jgi:cellulose synthase/poly-beta-1,6-N-acetylglucosamine synthase-like glycosyltransferase
VTLLAQTLFWIFVALIVGQGVLVCGFLFALARSKRQPLADVDCPQAAVILCLRGPDPFLARTVHAMLTLDYPRFDVRIVVDQCEDPAWNVAEKVVAECQESGKCRAGSVEIQPLTERRETCSLKCSSVIQAVHGLDESYEVVALLDADTIPHATWLRELVAPLKDSRIGAATGNRWYMPHEPSWGALVRYLWNAAAVVQMYSYGIAWGGTLAVKTGVFRQSNLLDRWGNALCEDTMLFARLREQGLKAAFVPSLMMVNREACDIRGFFLWVRRQLLTARLYHPGWAGVVFHGISISVAMVAAVVFMLWTCLMGPGEAAVWFAAGLAAFCLCNVLMLAALEVCVRPIVRRRGEPTDWMNFGTFIKTLCAVPLTQAIYAAVLFSAVLIRKVEWRGVWYTIGGPWNIRLVEYRPYDVSAVAADANESL